MIADGVLSKTGNYSAENDRLVSVPTDISHLSNFILCWVYLHHFFTKVFRLDIFDADKPATYQLLMLIRQSSDKQTVTNSLETNGNE